MKLLICFIGVSSLLLLVFCLYTTLNTPEKVVQPLIPGPDQNVISYELLRSQNAALVPEKYNEHEVKSRIIRDKIKRLAGGRNTDLSSPVRRNRTIALNQNIQIFYYAPVAWYRSHPTVPSDRVSLLRCNYIYFSLPLSYIIKVYRMVKGSLQTHVKNNIDHY